MTPKYLVSLTDIHGTPWALTRGAPGRSGVDLMGPLGLRTPITVNARSTTQQVGATMTGWSGGPMESTVKLGIHAEDAPLAEVHGLFERGVSSRIEATLDVTLPNKDTVRAPVLISLTDAEKSPATAGLHGIHIDATMKSLQGCWLGLPEEHTDRSIIYNPGDLDIWPTIRWTGAGKSVTAPGIGVVPLPNAGSRVAELETSPEVASRVRVDGVDAPDLWRGMRGRLFPLPIKATSSEEWTFSGCVGITRSAHTNPWRW